MLTSASAARFIAESPFPRIPTESDYRMLIGLDANTDRIPTYSIRDVVQGSLAPEAFKDRYPRIWPGVSIDHDESFNRPLFTPY